MTSGRLARAGTPCSAQCGAECIGLSLRDKIKRKTKNGNRIPMIGIILKVHFSERSVGWVNLISEGIRKRIVFKVQT